MVAWSTLLAAAIAHAAVYWTAILNFAVIFTPVVAGMGVPIIALNFMGEQKEVRQHCCTAVRIAWIDGSQMKSVYCLDVQCMSMQLLRHQCP